MDHDFRQRAGNRENGESGAMKIEPKIETSEFKTNGCTFIGEQGIVPYIYLVNPEQGNYLAEWSQQPYCNPPYQKPQKFVLWFGPAFAPIRLMVWARSLEAALDECVSWLEDHAPEVFCDDYVAKEYRRFREEGKSEEEARELAEQDTTICDGGHYIASEEWGIIFENPTRKELEAYLKGT